MQEEEEEVIYEEVVVDDEEDVEEEIVEEEEGVGAEDEMERTPSTHASESDNMSEQGWSDRDDATSTGGTRDSAGDDSVGDESPVSPLGGDPLSPQTQTERQEEAPPPSPQKERRKKKKPKRGQRGPDADGYHGREIDMDHVKETGKDYYKRLKEAEMARKAELARKIRERQARAKRMTLEAIRKSKPPIGDVEDDDESEHTVDFIDDPIEEMTYARRFALNWLYKKDWYRKLSNYTTDDFYDEEDNNDEAGGTGKSARSSIRSKRKSSRMALDNKSIHSMVFDTRDDEAEKPSLARAWAYFEHVSLDRYIVKEKEEEEKEEPEGLLGRLYHRFFAGERELRRAAPGTTDVKTRLFDPFNTPHSQLGNFGIAVGLYFSTVRIVGLICFIAGIINSYSMWYFSTDKYMPEENRENLPLLLKGSAICNYTSWVACPECNCTDNPDDEKTDRCAIVNDTITGEELTFALKNNCDATVWEVAATNYVSVIFIMISIVGLGIYLQYEEVIFDEDQQTTQDYSIRITNPPGDATDPEEWRTYFREQCDGAQVTVCTCALDNDLLVQALVKRRETFRSIRNALPAGTPLDVLSLAQEAAEQERKRSVLDSLIGKILPGVPENFAFLVIMNARIQALAQLKYYTTQVYISFEKEEHQRHVLETLTVGSVRAKRNVKSALPDPKYLFRGKYVLNVEKATEPNTIHWDSLNVAGLRKVLQQTLTNLITLASIICVALVVKAANEFSTFFAALMISGFNAGFPEAAKIIVLLESHDNEGSKQRSLFFKIAAFRWVNTAIVISIITPFTRTLAIESGLLPQIAAIFLSEIVTLNIIQMTDAYGHFRRLCVAPFMQNQDAMNLWFRGEEVELAERYTNMTKIFFLALWYSSILPGGFFMAALALFINYFTDRFGIMRTWKRAAHLGSEVSFISRKYFFSLANVAMAFISAYYWAGFPFDNLCDTGKSIDPNSPYVGNFIVIPDPEEPDETYNATVSGGETVYEYCSQDMFAPFTFPFVPSKQAQEGRGAWMTPTQEQITTIFGWSSLGVLFVVASRILSGGVKGYFKSIRGRFRAIGEVQGIDFSEVPVISAYIPQVESFFFSYPLVVCDTDAFRKSLFDWEDPEKAHSYYDLTKDADALMDQESFDKDKCFSRVRYWRPGDE